MDNGDAMKASPRVTRVISQMSYNALSCITQTTGSIGLATSYTYDTLSRPLQATGSGHGNKDQK